LEKTLILFYLQFLFLHLSKQLIQFVMKNLSTIILLHLYFICSSQNVGIGKSNPSEKLDVNGNVNISGTVKANGVAGTTGQVLTSTGSGLAWSSIGSAMGYKKCIMLGSTSWNIPANVNEVMVEIWGGGAGGAGNAGGISGSYARTVKTVIPGTSITCIAGNGGTGQNGTTNPTSGVASRATFSDGSYLEAAGGYITLNSVASGWLGYPDLGYAYNLDNYYLIPGNMGERTSHIFGQKSATVFTEQVQYGAGGIPVGLLSANPNIGSSYYYENGSTVFSKIARLPYVANPYYGSGGSADSDTYGQPGGNGLILIWWNN
jgi:hypothetical protein